MTQTIAQLKANGHETLWQFLAQVPNSTEAQIWYAMMFGCIIGMVAHYVRQWATGQISGGLWTYLFVQCPRNTLLALIGAAMVSAGEVSMDLYQSAGGDVFSWWLIIISGFKNGYATDSLINRARRAEWSQEQRAANQPQETKP